MTPLRTDLLSWFVKPSLLAYHLLRNSSIKYLSIPLWRYLFRATSKDRQMKPMTKDLLFQEHFIMNSTDTDELEKYTITTHSPSKAS